MEQLKKEINRVKISSYKDYCRLRLEDKNKFDKLFWKYMENGLWSSDKKEFKSQTNIAVNENFPKGITQSILYTKKIIIITSKINSYQENHKVFNEKSVKTFFKYYNFIDQGIMHLIPEKHYHMGLDEYDDSDTYFDESKWSSIRFEENLMFKIKANFELEKKSKPRKALLNLNINFPLVQNVSDKELLKIVSQEEIFHNYQVELKRLHNLQEKSVDEYSFLEKIEEINENVLELNSKINGLKSNVKYKLIESGIGATVTIFSILVSGEIAEIINSIVGSSTLLNISNTIKEHQDNMKTIKESPYYFAWKLLK